MDKRRPRSESQPGKSLTAPGLRLAVWRWRFALLALAAGVAATGAIGALAPPPPPTSPVVFAARELAVGTVLTPEDLVVAPFPAQHKAGLVGDPAAVVGRTVLLGIPAGIPLWEAAVSAGSLAEVSPPGSVVVPLRLEAALTATLAPGDVVDLMAVGADGPVVLARSALVLPGRAAEAASGLFGTTAAASVVTLVAVDPAEAPALAGAAHHGQVTAILVP